MDIFFKRMHDTMNPGEDAVWCPVPKSVQSAIKRWQTVLVDAVPVAKLSRKLSIVMMTGLFRFERDLPAIINAASRATPMSAMLTNLQIRRVNELETALVIQVDCPELCDLHAQIAGVVAYPVDVSGPYRPCIEIARFENMIVQSIEGLENIQASGITNAKWIIDEILAGTEKSHCECALLGHSPLTFSVDGVGDSVFGKAAGMSTLDMASGGGLMNTEFSIDIEDDDDEEDESDEGWMARALDLADVLEGEY